MQVQRIRLIKSLNKTFRKEQVGRIGFDNFKSEMQILLSKILNTFFTENEINTKDRTDLAIYSENTNKTPVNVIFEIKKPRSSEFPTNENINCKALHEKINGYKKGSFFTPGYITMYMSRETIRQSVIQKFREAGYQLSVSLEFTGSFAGLKTKIKNRDEANQIINSIKIIDPVVGSGSFLVFALNEIIAIKSELDILNYKSGKRIKDYKAEVINDELIITNLETEEIFEYTLNEKSNIMPYKQEFQESVFNENQTIIENCLFGTDINPNSVNICRLRLWIELLKHTFFTIKNNYKELETLPNIDINIKQGNSLINNFGINGNGMPNGLSQKVKLATKKYKEQVIIYKSTADKRVKKNAERRISEIKEMFARIVRPLDKDYKLLKEKEAKLGEMSLFFTPADKENWEKQRQEFQQEIDLLKRNLEKTRESIYKNAFEWRFEFPEVLNENGSFAGFDVVIGNSPYFQLQYVAFNYSQIKERYTIFQEAGDIYSLFIELAINISKPNAFLSYIVSNRFCFTNYGYSSRKFISKYNLQKLININNINVFDEANVGTLILSLKNEAPNDNKIQIDKIEEKEKLIHLHQFDIDFETIPKKYFSGQQWIFENEIFHQITGKMKDTGIPLSEITDIKINRGVTTGANDIFIIDKKIKDSLISPKNKSEEINKPVLKEAEIKQYYIHKPVNYIILTKTGIDIEKYSTIYKYLLKNKDKPGKVYESKKGHEKWYELRKCSFYHTFKEEKLIWTRLSNINYFAISVNQEYSVDSTSFATGKHLKFYRAILNPKAVYFYFKLGFVTWGKDGIKWFGEYFDNIPIPYTNATTKDRLEQLVTEIMQQKNKNPNTKTIKYEKEIDKIVYTLYGLTKNEIAKIEEYYKKQRNTTNYN